jgi:hypothetical protein
MHFTVRCRLPSAPQSRVDGAGLSLVKALEVTAVHVRVRAHDASGGVAIRTQEEVAHFVGDNVSERVREIRWGAGHRRDAIAEDRRAAAGRMGLAEYTVFDTPRLDLLFGHIARE